MKGFRQESFIEDSLSKWRLEACPSQSDFHLAEKIANGTMQMKLALDFFATQISDKKKLSLKTKELVLLRMALYQYYFLERIPIYAIADESVKIARKYCHSTFVNYLNASLRRLPEKSIQLPQKDNLSDLSIRYSYPEFFVKELLDSHGTSKTKEILAAGNAPAPVSVRLRVPHKEIQSSWINGIKMVGEKTGILQDPQILPEIIKSPLCYIQNLTPAHFINSFSNSVKYLPDSILDLCASPGGKLIAVHDAFPHAHLFANDISEEKILRLKENCEKYGITATLSCQPGETYVSDQKFDIIIIDAPCSNSGVLNKRPEARWRLSKEALIALEVLQLKLIENAVSLLSQQGEIWYMTCSILSSENEKLVERACQQYGLTIGHQELILPNQEGWDGGYACKLMQNI